jgi:hypothetical protein
LKNIDGHACDTFQEAATLRGLMANDEEIEFIVQEMIGTQCSTSEMCDFFALILVWHDVGDARDLWTNTWRDLATTFLHRGLSDVNAHNEVLRLIDHTLSRFGLTSQRYLLMPLKCPDVPRAAGPPAETCKEIKEERSSFPTAAEKDKLDHMEPLTGEQQIIFDEFCESVDAPAWTNTPNVSYVEGPAGSGKTYLYTRILRHFRSQGRLALAVCMSGIAALLLEGGRTAHSRFRLSVPLPLDGATANISANSGIAKLLREVALIIWDEAPNAPKAAFDAVDRCLRDLLQHEPNRSKALPFGGMPMLLGGDFRQIPPVLRRVDNDAMPSYSVNACSFWGNATHMRRYTLHRNKRAEGDADYAAFLLDIGSGTYQRKADGSLDLPSCVTILPSDVPNTADGVESLRKHECFPPSTPVHPATI